jgi:hypothetical protein
VSDGLSRSVAMLRSGSSRVAANAASRLHRSLDPAAYAVTARPQGVVPSQPPAAPILLPFADSSCVIARAC